MLSGVKFISRDQIEEGKNEELDACKKDSKNLNRRKEKSRRKKRDSRYSNSEDEELEKIKKVSRKKKWYSSDEYSASSSAGDESDSSFRENEKRHKSRDKKGKNRDSSLDDAGKRSKHKSKRSKKEYSSEDNSSYSYESEEHDHRAKRKQRRSKAKDRVRKDDDMDMSDGAGDNVDIVRKEMGLEWMLKPAERADGNAKPTYEEQPEDAPSEETHKVNPRELNPYLRDNGSGYPEDEDAGQRKTSRDRLLSSSLVGDGGASWRLKALKRAQEQAAREGRNLEEVVQERWGSLGHIAVSVASHSAAAPRAHLHAIKSRKMGVGHEVKSDKNNQSTSNSGKETGREYLKDVSVRHPELRAPKVRDSLSWGGRKSQSMHNKDAALISNAVSQLNKFANDGGFMREFTTQNNEGECGSHDALDSKSEGIQESESSLSVKKSNEEKQPLSANQLAAKAIQLRLKGKHEEADKLLKEAENTKAEQGTGERLITQRNTINASRYVMQDIKMRQKEKEDDSDIHLAKSIMKNKQFGVSTSTQADDEYDYDRAPSKKSRRKRAEHDNNRSGAGKNAAKHIMTQQERCLFCFENPKRSKHLVVSIANFTYLMLPQYEPVVPGHCCILPLQHELATRMVDDHVWEEIRNFKKCLIMMFAKQDKDVIFLETVLWLAQQNRHCLIECIPLPQEISKEAPLYFKKAIDEVEDEWSQHDAKKLIDTSQKGLRASIPKNFPYFHVEFGLNKGFVHVIDDETQFKSSFGLNVVRGMLKLHDEDMYRRRRSYSFEAQKEAVVAFAKDWEPFDWTKQLD